MGISWQKSKVKKILRCVLGIAGALLLIPPLQVLYVAWVNPSTTMPICLRAVTLKLFGVDTAAVRVSWLNLSESPYYFLKTIWNAEDGEFFNHRGIDWEQVRLAREKAAKTGAPMRGASTISQQCARSLFLWQKRSWIRKGLEAYYTFWMEVLLSKKRIFELYVNVIEFGDGIYGLEAASRHYYRVSPNELSREQLAMLVAIVPNPRQNNPLEPGVKLQERQALLMRRAANVNLPRELIASVHLGE